MQVIQDMVKTLLLLGCDGQHIQPSVNQQLDCQQHAPEQSHATNSMPTTTHQMLRFDHAIEMFAHGLISMTMLVGRSVSMT